MKAKNKKWLPYVITAGIAALAGYLYKIQQNVNYEKTLTVANAGTKVNDIYTAGYDLLKILGVIKK